MVFPRELVQIRESHTLFMKDLEERLGSSGKQFGIVGDIFTKLSSSYHVGRMYVLVSERLCPPCPSVLKFDVFLFAFVLLLCLYISVLVLVFVILNARARARA